MLLVSEVASSDPIKVMDVFVSVFLRISWLLLPTVCGFGTLDVGVL